MYDIHPGHFPSVTAAQYKKLKRGIRANGQMSPIALYEGMVWDGRARLQICGELGLKPKVCILRPKDQPVAYLLYSHDRYGEPRTKERSAALDILWHTVHGDWITDFKRRRTEWLREARNDFKSIVPKRVQNCEVCNDHAEFVHAHHTLPLSVQFELGLILPVHDFNWLCPTHHRHVHTMISVYVTDTRSGSFLDCILDHRVDEWLGVESVFAKSMKLFEQYGGMHQNGLGHDYNHSYWP
jgi:hypothetical protein